MTLNVAVRALCDFTSKAGDLDLRFTPSATALEGMAGHAMVTSRRGPGYESEITLSCEFEGLHVRGRADGYDAERRVVEEIKTYRGDLGAIPGNRRALHLAQARVYAWMMCIELGLDEIGVAIVYYDVATQVETASVERLSAAELKAHFEERCRRYLAWARQEAAHRTARDAALALLAFSHASFRPGQRELAEAVYKSAAAGRCLMAQAPTGIGKTVGTLFPLLKAMQGQRVDKAFFLTAKGPGRGVALAALRTIGADRMPLRVLELTARDKACEQPDKACHGASCPLAKDFFDRLPAARADAIGQPMLDRSGLRAVAASHGVCPYYLAQEMVRWADVIVGDYNYWFDANAMLHGMTTANEWRVGVLVDEAHNLVERARSMYSATLDRAALLRVIDVAPAAVKLALVKLCRVWRDMESLELEAARSASSPSSSSDAAYIVRETMPDAMASALSQSISVVADFLAAQPAGTEPRADSPLLRWHFDALRFARLLESFGDHTLLELIVDGSAEETGDALLRLRNVVPAPFLKPKFAAAHTTTLFSATLSPTLYYSDMLGLPEDALSIDVASPFEPAQLRVEIASHVSTRYRSRARSLRPIAELIARQYARQPGNYLAFFSSFDYLNAVACELEDGAPAVPVWRQSANMDDVARHDFLRRFDASTGGIGFAVLGGAFGEGIDLPGDRLIGAFIATLGLPPVNPANEQVRARMEKMFGAGYAYAYLNPGMTKVVQAAGRVIRSPSDRGSVHLIDERYARADVRALLPNWWKLQHELPRRGLHAGSLPASLPGI